MDIHHLIEALRQAKTGSAELDFAIAEIVIKGPRVRGREPAFTTSIDEARRAIPRPLGSMSLASRFEVGGFADVRPFGSFAKVWYDPSMAGAPREVGYICKRATSPALALCCASMMARGGDRYMTIIGGNGEIMRQPLD
jgi:hypothetical protein